MLSGVILAVAVPRLVPGRSVTMAALAELVVGGHHRVPGETGGPAAKGGGGPAGGRSCRLLLAWRGGWIYLADGWRNAGQAGTATQGNRSELVLRPGSDGRPLALDVTLSADAGLTQNGSQVAIVLNGTEAARWSTPRLGQPSVGSICLPVRVAGKAHEILSVVLEKHEPVAVSVPASIVLQSISLRETVGNECGRGSNLRG